MKSVEDAVKAYVDRIILMCNQTEIMLPSTVFEYLQILSEAPYLVTTYAPFVRHEMERIKNKSMMEITREICFQLEGYCKELQRQADSAYKYT